MHSLPVKVLTIGSDPGLKKPGGIVTHMRLLCSLEVFGEIVPLDIGSVRGTAALDGAFPVVRVVRNLARLRRRLGRERFDVVMIHQPASGSALVKLAMTLLAIPPAYHDRLLVFFHGGRYEQIRYLRVRLVVSAFRRVFERVRRFYFLSRPEREGFEAVFPGLPVADFANYSERDAPLPRAASHPETLRLLYVGRVDEIKGVFTVLHAVAAIVREGLADVHLTVVGTGPHLERLRAEAAATVPGHVAFTGFLQGEALEDRYRAADLFVMPTRHPEGFPYVVIEAMRAGLPLITTPEGALETIVVDGASGFQIRPDDVDQLVETILRFRDPRLLRRISEHNVAYFEQHMRRRRAEQFYARLLEEFVPDDAAKSSTNPQLFAR